MTTKSISTIEDIRLGNLHTLIKDWGDQRQPANSYGAVRAISKDSGVSEAYLSQIITRSKDANGKTREIGSKLARKLESGCDKPVGWMDVDNSVEKTDEKELLALFTLMDKDGQAALMEQAKFLTKTRKTHAR